MDSSVPKVPNAWSWTGAAAGGVVACGQHPDPDAQRMLAPIPNTVNLLKHALKIPITYERRSYLIRSNVFCNTLR